MAVFPRLTFYQASQQSSHAVANDESNILFESGS
jgi:hypothetical protein